MNNFDERQFFNILERLPPLVQTDPRLGCISRTQIIGSLLHEHGIAVGRAWILPVYEANSFIAPLFDSGGQPVKLNDPETNTQQIIKWRFHCATVLLDLPEQPIIDFPLFGAPVRLATWQNLFNTTQSRHTPKGQELSELRVVTHAFSDIPQRQVLRYNPQAQKQNKILPPRHLAKLVTFPLYPKSLPLLTFERHKGDCKAS